MARSVQLTPQIREKLSQRVPDLDLDAVDIYETVLISTKPLDQEGSLWHEGRLTFGVLKDIEAYFESEGNTAPLIQSHDHNSLPEGRVFSADLREDKLHGLFYVPKNTELSNSISLGIIDSVSVGVSTKHIYCSECGWDYLGEESTILNLMNQCCENDHYIGENGVHVIGDGLESFKELSLVMSGASTDAKILSSEEQQMAKREMLPLAASAIFKQAAMLKTSGAERKVNMADKEKTASSEKPEGDFSAELMKELVETKTELRLAQKEYEAKDAKVIELQNQIDSMKEKLERVECLEKKEAELSSVKEYLQGEAKKALVASGDSCDNIPDSAEDLVKLLASKTEMLAKNIPVGGVSQQASLKDAGSFEASALDFKRYTKEDK